MTDRLWAPWRNAYVAAPKQVTAGCLFCEKLLEGDDATNFIVLRGERVFVMLNAFPYTNGHLMIVPYEHQGDLAAVPLPTLDEMMAVVQRSMRVLRLTMRPSGFNVGMNLGAPAGAGIVDHLHLHVVPRWVGDTNFMPVVADAHVLSQSLAASYDLLSAAFRDVE